MNRFTMGTAIAAMLALAGCATTEHRVKATATIHMTLDASENRAVDADERKVLDAVKMIQSGHIHAAIDGPLNEVIAKYEATYAGRNVRVFCAKSGAMAILYAANAGTTQAASEKANTPIEVLGPAWAMAYWARGYAYNEMARYDDAKIEIEKALKLSPMDSQYRNELAFSYEMTRGWDKTLALYRQSVEEAELNPVEVVTELKCTAFRGQGYALVELHRLDEAAQAYNACLELKPGEPKSLGELGYIDGLRKKSH